ncbi:MAG: restriction endonuclease subunit S [Terriglobales bacterium]|jgi:type I restriction enzyme S subunit
MRWPLKRLDELGYVSRGRSRHRPRDAAHLYGGPFPFIQTGDVKHSSLYITEYTQTYSEAGLAQSRLWPVGTLCITIAANIADTSILGIEACFPDSVIGFIPDPREADARFIKYSFDALLQKQYQNFSKGAAQDNLSQEKLLSIDIPVPKAEMQTEIADVLANYDALIENNRRRIALLEQAARLLYEEWFVRFHFPGYEHAKFISGLPEGWTRRPASECLNILSGGTPKTENAAFWDGDIPFFTPKDADPSVFVFDTEKHLTERGLKECNSHLYPENTLLITARGTVGKMNLAGRPMAMNQSCYALVAHPPLTQEFLYFAISDGVRELRSQAGGAVFDAIIRNTFRFIPLIVPSDEAVTRFTEIIQAYLKSMVNLQSQIRCLQSARDLLLPRLMSGEVEV